MDVWKPFAWMNMYKTTQGHISIWSVVPGQSEPHYWNSPPDPLSIASVAVIAPSLDIYFAPESWIREIPHSLPGKMSAQTGFSCSAKTPTHEASAHTEARHSLACNFDLILQLCQNSDAWDVCTYQNMLPFCIFRCKTRHHPEEMTKVTIFFTVLSCTWMELCRTLHQYANLL